MWIKKSNQFLNEKVESHGRVLRESDALWRTQRWQITKYWRCEMYGICRQVCDDRLVFLEYRRKTKTCVIDPLISMKYFSQNIDSFTLKILQSETSKSTFTPITSNGISTVTMWHPALGTKISAPTHSICRVQDLKLLPHLFISRGGYPSRHVLIHVFKASGEVAIGSCVAIILLSFPSTAIDWFKASMNLKQLQGWGKLAAAACPRNGNFLRHLPLRPSLALVACSSATVAANCPLDIASWEHSRGIWSSRNR